MIVKFHSRGRGGGEGPVNYLLSEFGTVDGKMPKVEEQELGIGRRSVAPKLLRGDPQQTIEIINSLEFSSRYTSGVLSFEEADLPQAKKEQLMNTWEKTLFPGMSSDEYDCLWVEHRDKGRLELNFVIPKVHLPTGKQLNVYSYRADLGLVASFRKAVNAKNGWSDPDEPARKRAVSNPQNMSKNRKELKQQINDEVEQLVAAGLVDDRNDIIEVLESAGFEIALTKPKSISIKHPDGGQNVRLEGPLYEQDFRIDDHTPEAIEAAQKRFLESRTERATKARADYDRNVEHRRGRLEKRYQSSLRPWETAVEPEVVEEYRFSASRSAPDALYALGSPEVQSGHDRLSSGLSERRLDQVLSNRSRQSLQSEIGPYERIREVIATSIAAATEAVRAAVQRVGRSDRVTRGLDKVTYERHFERERSAELGSAPRGDRKLGTGLSM